jgi:hypothetical protein
VKAGRTLEDSLGRVIAVLTSRIRAAPPAAVARSISEFRHRSTGEFSPEDRVGFGVGFEMIFARAQELGELPADVASSEMARIMQALVMETILDWAACHTDLRSALRLRASILVAGLKQPVELIQ